MVKSLTMIVQHSPFSEMPENLNQKIWRYIDFTKFCDLLLSSTVYFARADLLIDEFEGSLTEQAILNRNTQVIINRYKCY